MEEIVEMVYTTNVDAFNDFFGLGLRGWFSGEYRLKTNPHRIIWFPRLDYLKYGRTVAGHPDWSNTFLDDAKEIIVTKPVYPDDPKAKTKLALCYWDSNVEMALFARAKNSNGIWEGKYMGIYCFLNGNQVIGERRYKRINKEINKKSAAGWLNKSNIP
jgi:hypothetical protein